MCYVLQANTTAIKTMLKNSKDTLKIPLCKLSLIAGAADANESVMSSYIFNKNIIPKKNKQTYKYQPLQ